jgi:hypothetical protein
VANDAEAIAGQGGEELGELPAAGCVDALQEPPVPEGGKSKVVVRQFVGPVAAEDAHGEVLVDHPHDRDSEVVGVVATQ